MFPDSTNVKYIFLTFMYNCFVRITHTWIYEYFLIMEKKILTLTMMKYTHKQRVTSLHIISLLLLCECCWMNSHMMWSLGYGDHCSSRPFESIYLLDSLSCLSVCCANIKPFHNLWYLLRVLLHMLSMKCGYNLSPRDRYDMNIYFIYIRFCVRQLWCFSLYFHEKLDQHSQEI